MKPPRILVAGIGNIFLGDDAFGVEVVRGMLSRPQPEGVQVRDFGIRGLDLAYTLLDGVEFAILVDAMPRGGTPGTLYVLEPEPDAWAEGISPQGHGMDPVKVLGMVCAMGGSVGRIRVVGCEPEPIDTEGEGTMELSPPVRAAVDGAVTLVESLIHDYLAVHVH